MKLSWIFCLGMVLLNIYSVSATGASMDPAAQKVVSTPIQAPASPGLLSVVEENVTLSPHGNDRHYTNGIKLAYTTGSLSENSIWSAPIRWLGESTFLFDRPNRETDERLEWTIVGQSFFTPENHHAS